MKSLGFGAYYYRHQNKWLSTGAPCNFLLQIESDSLILQGSKQNEESAEIDFKTSLVIDKDGYLSGGIGFTKNILRVSEVDNFVLQEEHNDHQIIFDMGTTVIIPSKDIPVGFHCWLLKNDLLGDDNLIDRVIIDIEDNDNEYITIRTGNKVHDLGIMEAGKWAKEIGNKRPTLLAGKEILLTKISYKGEEIWLISFGLVDEDVIF
jgi:hypothetical protein